MDSQPPNRIDGLEHETSEVDENISAKSTRPGKECSLSEPANEKRIVNLDPALGEPSEVEATRVGEETETVLVTIQRIEALIKEAMKRPEPTWYGSAYAKIQAVVKYIGIPALVLASVLPVQRFMQDVRASLRDDLLITTYTEYVDDLLRLGESERARQVLEELSDASKLDARTHYARAKIFAASAVRRGENIQQAEDTLNILIRLAEKSNVFAGAYGGDFERIKIRLLLSEVDVARSNYQSAIERLEELDGSIPEGQAHLKGELHLMLGTIAVAQHRIPEARRHLAEARDQLSKEPPRRDLVAETLFQVGKADQFSGRTADARRTYRRSILEFEKLGDPRGVIRATNNLGMIAFSEGDMTEASRLYNRCQDLARLTGDKVALGRTLLNLATIKHRSGDAMAAIADVLESIEIFKATDNLNGLAHSQGNVGRWYYLLGEYSEALYYTREALYSFVRLKEISRIGVQAGNLADIHRALGNEREFVHFDYVSGVFRRAASDSRWRQNMALLSTAKTRVGEESFDVFLDEARTLVHGLLESVDRLDIDLEIPTEYLLERDQTHSRGSKAGSPQLDGG